MSTPAPRCPRRAWRRVLALAAVALWLLGFELLPDVHLGWHARLGEHHHGHDATSHGHAHAAAHADDHAHAHAHGHAHVHVAAHAHADAPVRVPIARDTSASQRGIADGDLVRRRTTDHGRHDLLHRGLAVQPSPPVLPPIADAATAPLRFAPARAHPPAARALPTARARGPPQRARLHPSLA